MPTQPELLCGPYGVYARDVGRRRVTQHPHLKDVREGQGAKQREQPIDDAVRQQEPADRDEHGIEADRDQIITSLRKDPQVFRLDRG